MFGENSQIGPYTLIRKLGRGGFGEVWLAERRTKFVTTKVAVKLPLDEQIDHETIKQEATLWEQASGHPNILPIIDADEYDGQVVIVSEFAPDGSLDEWLKTHGKMPVERAIETTIKILDGLEFLHSRNIIHRDLKPANILLQGNTPRLADFGISRALRVTASSQSSNVSGTFAYMSPEGFDGKRSVQTDVWSVGVNLYQFLTGELPFPQKEPSNLLAAIIMREFESLPDNIPLNLKDVVANALAKLPENRYISAVEMREDLRKVLVNISFPQSTEALQLPIVLEHIATAETIKDKTATSEADQETSADEKPTDQPTVQLPIQAHHSSVTHVKEKESVVTRLATIKADTITQILPGKFQIHEPVGKKNNKLLFVILGGLVFVVFVLIIIKTDNSSNFSGATANINTNKTLAANTNSPTDFSTMTDNTSSITPNPTVTKGEVRKNLIGMEFVKIPSGSFMMGSEHGRADVKPAHRITISKGFWIGKYEVTQGQWESVMENDPSSFKNCGKDCPVENVSWDDAEKFVAQLNANNDGFEYRLPTEAEWEYAARAGTTGDYAGKLDDMAWYSKNSDSTTHPVGQRQPNGFGLYDMHGNVSEWCEDWYGSYESGSQADPKGASSGKNRVIRGGAWNSDAKDAFSYERYGPYPAFRNSNLGFRVVTRAR